MHCLCRCFGLVRTPNRPKVRSELTQSSTLPRKNVRRTACSATDGPERNRKRKRLNMKRISLGRRLIHLLPAGALKNGQCCSVSSLSKKRRREWLPAKLVLTCLQFQNRRRTQKEAEKFGN